MSSKIPLVKLNDGTSMPIIGLGTLGITAEDRDRVAEAVYKAITLGYRHIDTGYIYQVEDKVGQGIKRAIDEGIVKREDLFVVTKIWITNLKPENIEIQTRESLEDLNLSYVDLLMIHWPIALIHSGPKDFFPKTEEGHFSEDFSFDVFTDSWKGMENMVDLGLTKSIGVSNFNSRQLRTTFENARIKPSVNQVECTPFLSQEKLHKTCSELGVVLAAYSPFGGSPKVKDENGVMREHDVRKALFNNQVILSLANKYNKSVTHILLKFIVQRGIAVIAKTMTPSRMIENTNIFDFELSSEEMESLLSLNRNERANFDKGMDRCKNWPFNED
jgi:diketogulonate reductase-like aldo/keto reductase